MEEDVVVPWWRRLLAGMGFVLGLLALSGILMAGIIFIARFLDTAQSAMSAPPEPIAAEGPDGMAGDRPARPAFEPWPSHPRQPAGFIGDNRRLGYPGREPGVPPSRPPAAAKAPVATGLSVEEYRAAAAAGKPLYLPNPRGECDLNSGESLRALESCLAARAAR
jgi:hypothetical protein